MKTSTVTWSWRFHQSHNALSTSRMAPENAPLRDHLFNDSYDSDSEYESAEFAMPSPCLRRHKSMVNLGYVSDDDDTQGGIDVTEKSTRDGQATEGFTSGDKVAGPEFTSSDYVTGPEFTSSGQATGKEDPPPGEFTSGDNVTEDCSSSGKTTEKCTSGDDVTEDGSRSGQVTAGEKRKALEANVMAALLKVVKEQEEKLEEEKWKQRIILFLHKEMTELKESMNMLELAVTTIHDRFKEGQF